MRLAGGPSAFRHCAGVLGWPLDNTLSPAIHNAAFRALDLDWHYFAWPVEPELLGDAVRGLRALGAAGANVTMPHKESVIPFLDSLEGDAKKTGAVNTIHDRGGRLVGENTDVQGFSAFLGGDVGFRCNGADALVLGAGGAARAIVKALTDSGATTRVAARRPDAAGALSEVAAIEVVEWTGAAAAAKEADLVVNTTPLGMQGEQILDGAAFRSGQTVVDLVYSPPLTPMLESARAAGADAWGGIGMLVHQAAAAFRIWTGQEPPLETMSAAALHALRATNPS